MSFPYCSLVRYLFLALLLHGECLHCGGEERARCLCAAKDLRWARMEQSLAALRGGWRSS